MFMISNRSWNAVIGLIDNNQSSTFQGNQMVAGSSLPGKFKHCCLTKLLSLLFFFNRFHLCCESVVDVHKLFSASIVDV